VKVLRERNFRLYFVGQTTSAVGNAMVPVALAFAVLRLTGSAADLGWVLTSFAVSQLLFLLTGGVIADRVPRRLALLGSDVVRFTAEGILAGLLIAVRPQLLIVIMLVFVQGAASARLIPEAVLSRVLAYDWFGSLIAFPIGLAIAAPLATGVGLRLALVGGGILEIMSILGILAVRSVWNLERLDARSPAPGGDLA
jgi:MFS family permease